MNYKKEKLRIDKYLWCIRIFKSRTLATEACDKSKVKMHGNIMKASKAVSIGEEYEIKTEARKWLIKVSGLLNHRVQNSEAVNYFIDLTPAEEKELLQYQPSSFHTGKRLSKVGRPTKKERRDREDFIED